MPLRAALALQALLFATPPATSASEPDVEAICATAAGAKFPASGRPAAAEAGDLANCDAEALYYGFGVAADPVRARACAFAQVDAGDHLMFGGSNVLMMLYANGLGVSRALEPAIAVACRASHAPAEREARVKHLTALRAAPGDFDLCDDITSGYMQGMCTAHDERGQAIQRGRRRAALQARIPAPARADFAALERAATAFFGARVEHEVDLSGSGRGAFVIAERSSLEEAFVDLLSRTLSGDGPPPVGPDQYRATDADLNDLYPVSYTHLTLPTKRIV